MTFATVAGHNIASLELHVPGQGPWFADLDLETDPELSGRVQITLGELTLSGTVVPRFDGTRGAQRKTRIVGGAGGWSSSLAPKAYHADNGVRARLVAEDAARESGETLGSFAPAAETVGVDYVRQAGLASRVLEDVIGGSPWWVDYDGVTRVGPRSTVTPAADSYEVLDYDPRSRLVTLAMDDLRSVGIGSVLSARLDASQTVREMTVEVTPESVRVMAWTGGEAGTRGRVAGALRSIVERSTDRRLLGLFRYRVIRMSSNRVELQAINRAQGLPDVLPVSMWPGISGAHGDLTPGVEVLVQFVEGDRSMPVITHFAGKDGSGWAPVTLTLDATTIKLGATATDFVALASKVNSEIGKLWTALGTHVHGGVTAGSVSTSAATVTDTSASVAASKVKAT